MKRRSHSIAFKQKVIKEAIEIGNKAFIARKYDLNPNLIHKWLKTFRYHGQKYKGELHEEVSSNEVIRLQSENDQLKKLLGEKDLEIALLKNNKSS